jgi:hypothetical protein
MKRLLSLFLLISVSPLMASPSQFINWTKDQLNKVEFKQGLSAVSNDARKFVSAAYNAIPSKEQAVNAVIQCGNTYCNAIESFKNLVNREPLLIAISGVATAGLSILALSEYDKRHQIRTPEGIELIALNKFINNVDSFLKGHYDYSNVARGVRLKELHDELNAISVKSLSQEIQESFDLYKGFILAGALIEAQNSEEFSKCIETLKINVQYTFTKTTFWLDKSSKPVLTALLSGVGAGLFLAGVGIVNLIEPKVIIS